MRAVKYDRYGDPVEVLTYVETDAPAAPSADQVLIRVGARPIHPGDLLGIQGRYRGPGNHDDKVPGGAIPGFEGYGIVESVGPEVDASALKSGQRVAFFPARGAWGEQVLVAEQFVVPVPDAMPDSTAAQLHVTTLTSILLLRAAAAAGVRTERGDVILLTAAGSAVARLTTLLAGRQGIEVVNVVRSRAGAKALRARLPGVPVFSTDEPSWNSDIKAAVSGADIRVVLDPVGGPLAGDFVDLLSNGGTYLSYGDLSGSPMELPALSFSTRGISVRGVTVGSWASLPLAQRQADVAEAIELALDKPEHYSVESAYPLSQFKQALQDAVKTGKSGAVILSSL